MKSISLSALLILSIVLLKANAKTQTQTQFSNDMKEEYFDQILDHFNKQDTRTFQQHFWITDYYYKPGCPIFLYICGQKDCPIDIDENEFLLEEVRKFNGLYIALEHRYYGFSQPFDDLKTVNLAYLTVEQAFEDIAYFINWFKENPPVPIQTAPWITIGKGYGGTLAAWSRAKYPDLIVSSWASSSPVVTSPTVANYDENVHHVYNTTENACSYLLQQVFNYFEYQLYNTTFIEQKAFKALFGKDALRLTQEEMLFYFAEIYSYLEEEGRAAIECSYLMEYSDFKTVIFRVIAVMSDFSPRPYSSYYLSNPSLDWSSGIYRGLGRQQFYQSCTQLGWFKLPSKDPNYGIRSQRLTLDFYKKLCKESFGIEFNPTPDSLNKEFGDFDINAVNLIIVTGIEDPWLGLNLLKNKGDYESILIDCQGCSKGREIGLIKSKEDHHVIKARAKVHDFLVRVLL